MYCSGTKRAVYETLGALLIPPNSAENWDNNFLAAVALVAANIHRAPYNNWEGQHLGPAETWVWLKRWSWMWTW
jgi:hypothetical protein